MLYQLKRSDFYEYIEEKGDIPEYAIFVFIGHHLYRIFANKYAVNNYYLDYKYKNGIMEEVHNPLVYYLNGLYIVRKYIENIYLFKILSRENADKNFDLLKLYFEDARRELQKRYPGIKFIILKYPVEDEYYDYELYPDYYYYEYTFKSPRWKELEQEGFIIVDLLKCIDVDLSSKKYTFPDGHPNAKAWDIITERLSKDIITKI